MSRYRTGLSVGTFLFLAGVGPSAVGAQGPISVSCTGLQWYEAGKQAPMSYYVDGHHNLEQNATFYEQGWSNAGATLTHLTAYPYSDLLSTDGRAMLRQVKVNVVCWHYAVAGTGGYDTASSTTLQGIPEQYLMVGEQEDGPGGDHTGGSDCWYLVLADEHGYPLVDGSGHYYIIDTLGDC